MPPDVSRNANTPSSKRSFDQSIFSTHHNSQLDWDSHYLQANDRESQREINHLEPSSPYSPSKRRPFCFSCSSSMLADHDSIMSESFPSFMSVFGSEESEIYRRVDIDDQAKLDQNAFAFIDNQSAAPPLAQQHNKPFAHRGSIPSLFSGSSESSPTTTNSTFDSPLVSDASASSSPESAISTAPLSDFRAMAMPTEGKSAMALTTNPHPAPPREDVPTVQETAKNVKKLTLDMQPSALRRPATAGAVESTHPFSAPTSPLKEPIRSGRKKPTNLTIRTPGYNQLTFPRATGNVPPTPSSRVGLQQYQPSPALPSLASPRATPAGGMFLPLPSLNTSQFTSSPAFNKRSSLLINSTPDLRDETDNQIPKSQEAPERGYTNGPVCIYDCGVYLYLEPTAAEACEFDTVINVAKEVRNPLDNHDGERTIMSVWRADSTTDKQEITEPQTATSEYSFKSAWEWPQQSNTTPTATTPTQSFFTQGQKQPEYVHVRWDHNSEILDDLFPLCKLIDDRVAQNKKVLVHCQLGVSRSASLIIAYGLYKNYQPNFHSMYMAVKDRSRWVGPNMSLIYQLNDFKSKVDRGDESLYKKQADPAWFVRSPDGPPTPKTIESAPAASATTNPSFRAFDFPVTTKTESSKPSPPKLNKALPPVPLFPKDNEDAPKKVMGDVPSAPPPPQKTPTTIKRAASRPLPFRERGTDMSIPAHKPRFLPGITLPQSSAKMDLAVKDVPSAPSLFSPRAAEFMATPFNIKGAGDLETPGNRSSKEIPSGFNWLPLRKEGHIRTPSKDPRSPHQKAESKEIFRSIDNFL